MRVLPTVTLTPTDCDVSLGFAMKMVHEGGSYLCWHLLLLPCRPAGKNKALNVYEIALNLKGNAELSSYYNMFHYTH